MPHAKFLAPSENEVHVRSKFTALLAVIPVFALSGQSTPKIDHHQHFFSPAAAALVSGDSTARGIDAKQVIALLDSARIQKAVVLSVAYTWTSASRPPVENEYEKTKAENDWTSQQVAQYPDRLVGFCSLNPLKPYALDELSRCAKDPHLKRGLKLHFGNSDVDLDNPDNIEQTRKVFQAANERGMAIVVHMRTSISKRRNYGRKQALVFLNSILPAAPNVPVQIAHLAGAGDFDPTIDSALTVFIEAIAKNDRRMKNVWFDVTSVAHPGTTPERASLIARRIRQLNVKRVLYGSDAHSSPDAAPRRAWSIFQKVPLTPKEFRTIAGNVAPYMKR